MADEKGKMELDKNETTRKSEFENDVIDDTQMIIYD